MAQSIPPVGKLQGKVALVTGGASGIGETTVRLFAIHGARAVVIADIMDDKGQKLAEAIGSSQSQCAYRRCDVTDEDQVKAAVEWTVTTYGQLDVIFCNAGIASPSDQALLELDFAEFDRLMVVNARGVAACVKHAARAMVERLVRGSIVCTASVVASKGGWKHTDYIMSKHAVLALVRAASQQLGEHGIRVNCVSPFMVATPLTCDLMGLKAEELEKMFAPYTSLRGTPLRPGDVADAVLFLASDESRFVSGHDLKVDGGFETW
ncbi:(-)-isopiperitenol/(-)-carveol dehydrogenase, mitochondrial-like [Diospyros lotus]|uniref:(-)-isopiperitenol/(-)-carveol dehydrogenase, mitochondrial-like n=1 Tax=Diospyros lotus TaxID=55363 RepID=UPI002252C31B|nr:(-)-isopiperitenol/(-)-carveol dehydrogenase, mitochondrial-like [Diospyros lotus]